MHEAEDIPCRLFDEVRVREFGCEERNVALELGADGLETLLLELEESLALQELVSSREAVTAINGVIGEIAGRTETDKHNQRLPAR
jgi:hypothetical protein